MKILGLDIGNKRVGLSISDDLGMMAQPLFTLKRKGIDNDMNAMLSIIKDNKVEKLVVGQPKNMDGSNGFQWEKVKYFAERLELTLKNNGLDLEISYIDERLTTVSANRIMHENSVKVNKRKELVDTIAAVIILDTYLSMNK